MIFLLTASCGLAITTPEIPITSSNPSFFAILNETSFLFSSKTTCVIPYLSRKSKNMSPPRSLLLDIHPFRLTSLSKSLIESSPQVCVLLIILFILF